MDETRWIDRIGADLGGSLRFFSRLPVPPLSRSDDPAGRTRFDRAAWAVPLAGAILTFPAAFLAALMAHSNLPQIAAGALIVAAATLVTGALHEDGLADTADGLAGGHDRERRLEIMKDSRIGVFGAAALALCLLARASLAGALVGMGPIAAAAGLFAAAAAGRAAMVAAWAALPPARQTGLSASSGRPSPPTASFGIALGVVIVLLAVPGGFEPSRVGLGLLLGGAAAATIAAVARRTIGGQTGDILGAVEQVAEIGFLVGLLA